MHNCIFFLALTVLKTIISVKFRDFLGFLTLKHPIIVGDK